MNNLINNKLTPIDLRVKFKLETGYHPFHCLVRLGCYWREVPISYINGKFKREYGLRLEEKIGNYKTLRKNYKKFCGLEATYNHKDNIKPDYIIWLEDLVAEYNLSF